MRSKRCAMPAARWRGRSATSFVPRPRTVLDARRHRARLGRGGRTRRGDRLRLQPVDGELRPGGSSWQSLARGVGTIETDYLNGEIVLLGRLHGVPTPANTGAPDTRPPNGAVGGRSWGHPPGSVAVGDRAVIPGRDASDPASVSREPGFSGRALTVPRRRAGGWGVSGCRRCRRRRTGRRRSRSRCRRGHADPVRTRRTRGARWRRRPIPGRFRSPERVRRRHPR